MTFLRGYADGAVLKGINIESNIFYSDPTNYATLMGMNFLCNGGNSVILIRVIRR